MIHHTSTLPPRSWNRPGHSQRRRPYRWGSPPGVGLRQGRTRSSAERLKWFHDFRIFFVCAQGFGQTEYMQHVNFYQWNSTVVCQCRSTHRHSRMPDSRRQRRLPFLQLHIRLAFGKSAPNFPASYFSSHVSCVPLFSHPPRHRHQHVCHQNLMPALFLENVPHVSAICSRYQLQIPKP